MHRNPLPAVVLLLGPLGGCVESSGGMVSVPAGEFTMGCSNAACPGDEQPAHKVKLDSFHISVFEVTWNDFRDCVRRRDCKDPSGNLDTDGDRPVTNVSYDQAKAYCESEGKRLPTEAEWERAARGTDNRRYPWGDDAPDCTKAWTYGCGMTPHSARSGSARSPVGALHMAGNVREWVSDVYAESYPSATLTNPKGPSSGDRRVNRGGSFKYGPEEARVTARVGEAPSTAVGDLGFRCAM